MTTYRQYGASPADYLSDPATGIPQKFAAITVWTAETAGEQVTDLLDASQTPAVVVSSDSLGGFRFWAPDTLPSLLWIQGVGVQRYAAHPVDLGTRLDQLEAAVAAIAAGGGGGGGGGGPFVVDRLGQRLMEYIERDIRDCSGMVISDSVGAENPDTPDPFEWVRRWGWHFRDQYPNWRVLFVPLNYSTFVYRTPIVLGAGTNYGTASMVTTSGSATVATGTPGAGTANARWRKRPISGPGIPAGAIVNSVSGNGESIVLTLPATASATITATIGPRTLTLWGCGTPGKYVQEIQAHIDTIVGDPQPDCVIISEGHNFGFGEADKRRTLMQLAESVTDIVPRAEVILLAQNFKTNVADEELYLPVMRELAQECGYGLIDIRSVFLAADPDGDLLLDNAHPTDEGNQLWADNVWGRFYPWNPAYVPRVQLESSFTQPVDSLLVNSDFGTFSPLLGWNGSNVVLSKDVVNVDNRDAARGYSVNIAAASAASAYIEQVITGDALKPLLGRTVTFLGKVRVPAGGDNQAGILSILDTNPTDTSLSSSNVTDEGMGAFRWTMVTRRVRLDCTTLKLRIYADSGTDGTGQVSISRTCLAFGIRPRDCKQSPASLQGGTALWIKGDEIAAALGDGTAVASATDASGRLRHLTQATSGNQPVAKTNIQNGLGVLRFDGAGDFLQAVFTLPRPYTAFVVCKYRAAFSALAMVLAGAGNNAGQLSRLSSTVMQLQSTSAGPQVITTPEAFHLYTCKFDITAGRLAVDGGAFVGVANMGGSDPLGVTLGANGLGAGAQSSALEFAELVIIPGLLPDADQLQWQSDLKTKWALP